MTRRFLITGAQGFIGRYLVAHLLDRFPDSAALGLGRSPRQDETFLHYVTYQDRPTRGSLPEYLRNLNADRYSYVSCDLSSSKLAGVIQQFNPTAVVHLAASLRGISEEIVSENNVRGTEGLLSSLRESGVEVCLLLFASTGGVYGRQQCLPIPETAPVRPINLYSRSKLTCESLVHSFSVQTGIPIAIGRVFNVFGPGQDEFHFAGRITGQIAAILAGKSTSTVRAGPLSGTRDFLDVRDVCSGISTVLEQNLAGVCNIASGVETRVGNLLNLLLQAAGLENTVQIVQETVRPDPIPRHFANIDRLANVGFVPRHPIAKTCRDMLSYHSRLTYGRSPA